MLCYCKKCGRIVYFILESDKRICDCCKSTVYPVPNEYLDCKFSVDPNKKEEFIEKYIKPAIDLNLIAPKFPDTPRHPKQKYYLTDLGKTMLEYLSNNKE